MSAPDIIRVASAQYHLRGIDSFEQFAAQASAYVAAAAEFEAAVLLLPEFLTTQLLSIRGEDGKPLPFRALTNFTERYVGLFKDQAKARGLVIIAGTHVIARGPNLYNTAHIFFPDGRVATQPKLHLTPCEVTPWGLSPGDALELIELPFGKAAVLICYDLEFPELARMARARGAEVIFAPSCTDDDHGFHRVRHCAHARAIEDQVYVVTSHTVGSLPVEYMRANAGQAAILTPNDMQFPPGGVIAQGVMNADQLVVGELDFAALRRSRERGSVRTWQDRRGDLYPVIE